MRMKMSKGGKFILGLGGGVGLGLLFAPKKGEETRQELKAKCEELLNKVVNSVDELSNVNGVFDIEKDSIFAVRNTNNNKYNTSNY